MIALPPLAGTVHVTLTERFPEVPLSKGATGTVDGGGGGGGGGATSVPTKSSRFGDPAPGEVT